MKFGSVRFFKALIVTVLVLLILIPVALAVLFGVLYAGQKARADELEAVNRVLVDDFVEAMPSLSGVLDVDTLPPFMQGEEYTVPPSFEYQTLYPHLYAQRPAEQTAEAGVCYLTFDDGPSSVTQRVLDTLDEYGIKATFFVTGRASELDEEILKAAADAGHTIGVHSYSHDYPVIYASVEAFLEDFDRMYRRIVEVTGTAPEVFRFPGGSVNAYNRAVYTEIVAEMLRRGFVFYDWNVAANDAVVGGISQTEIANNVLRGAAGKERIVVLMHDRTDTANTAAALPAIIKGLTEQGFRFEALTNAVQPITYYYTGN